MRTDLVHALSVQRKSIASRWEAYLRIEPFPSPLANPDTLVFGIDVVLNELFMLLRRSAVKDSQKHPDCRCECNPLRAFYAAGEQALLETLILLQANDRTRAAGEQIAALDELRNTFLMIARRDVEGLSSLCASCNPRASQAGTSCEHRTSASIAPDSQNAQHGSDRFVPRSASGTMNRDGAGT